MYKHSTYQDDPYTTKHPQNPQSTASKWATCIRSVAPSSRFSGLRITPMKMMIIFLTTAGLILLHDWLPRPSTWRGKSQLAFLPPKAESFTESDTLDTFASYRFRDVCNISSLDLHSASSPLCTERAAMLTAMSSGGRIGFDAPYVPRGCDMRWFTSEEVCEILGRFERVVLVGDSFLRHVTGSINILLRKDVGYGAVTDWNFSVQERRECFCNEQFNVKACSVQGIYKTADVLAKDPTSLSCSNRVNLIMEEIVKVPIPPHEINQLKASILGSKGKKAFIFGHGLWSDLDMEKTREWFDTVLHTIESVAGKDWKGLMVTPSAAGKEKPKEWVVTQGNEALMVYEEVVGLMAKERSAGRIEHLGTWNMSIQARKYDGVHLDMRGNLVKAMMVLNWLNLL